MDLTVSIRLKIDRLRTAKTARYNALSTAIEKEIALLTQRSAELFTKLEDALEADVLGKSDEPEDLKRVGDEEEVEKEDVIDEDGGAEESLIKERHADPIQEGYGYEGDPYYGHEVDGKYYERRQPSLTPSISAKAQKQEEAATNDATTAPALTEAGSSVKPSEPLVSHLRSGAQETQRLLAEKHAALTSLRQKHETAMKRLDRLQRDLETVSQKWEAEERARIQSESTTALGKRKREDEDHENRPKRWKTLGLKGVEWGVLFGFGVISAVGISKLQPQ